MCIATGLQGTLTSVVFLAMFMGGAGHIRATEIMYLLGRGGMPGAYNSPGAFASTAWYRGLAASQSFDGYYPKATADSEGLGLHVDFVPGPAYYGAKSGTVMAATGYLARALVDHSRTLAARVVGGRVSTPYSVTVVELDGLAASPGELHPTVVLRPPVSAIVLFGVLCGAVSAMSGDVVGFAVIVVGMASNWMMSSALRRGELTFTHPLAAPGTPPGDGYLESGTEFLVLKGSEGAVASVTRGRFVVRFRGPGSRLRLRLSAAVCTAVCFLQFAAVAWLSVAGLACVLVSIVASAAFEAYVGSRARGAWERVVLDDVLARPRMERRVFGSRTAAAVFIAKQLATDETEKVLGRLLPNDTGVWRYWRRSVARGLQSGARDPFFIRVDVLPGTGFSTEERTLLGVLFDDATVGASE